MPTPENRPGLPRIFIVEDEPIVAADLRNRLRVLGYAVAGAAAEGRRALEAIAQELPDLVLMDIQLRGDWDGVEVARKVRAQWQLPVVFLTAYSDEGTLGRAMETEPYNYVLKPFEDRELRTAIEMARHRHRAEMELRRVEAELREKEHVLKVLTDGMRDVLVLVDAQGIIRYVTPSVRQLLGREEATFVGTSPVAVVHEEDRPQAQEALVKVLSGKPVRRVEFRARHADGHVLWMEITADPIAEGGCVVYCRDITAQVQSERDRQQWQEQMARSQKIEALGRLAGGVAHDFNNILTAILVQASMIQEEPEATEAVRRMVGEVADEARRASQLTRQLLLFGRRQPVRRQRLNLNALVQNLLSMLRRVVGEQYALRWQAKADELWVEADTGMIEQVLTNLVVNARDAMPQGGQVMIEAVPVVWEEGAAAHHPQARAGRFACLTVVDEGCGMDDATRNRIFEPFFTTKEIGQGTGLGLATVFSIVQQHDGWIEVESAPGQGSTFRVYLPVSSEGGVGAEAVPAASVSARGGTEAVLVVEDEDGVRRLLVSVLRRLGYQVHEVQNGAEAITWLTELQVPIDLVVTDAVMPGGVSGVELIERVQALRPGVGVIVMSGYSAELIDHGLPGGESVSFIGKPFEVDDFTRLVRQSLDRRAVARAGRT